MTAGDFLRDPVLDALGIAHGFGTRRAPEPVGCRRPHQVHGAVVARLDDTGQVMPEEADALVGRRVGVPVAVVTADCVPVLLATVSGRAVAAVHAGWRGLAAGVIGEAVGALAALCEEPLAAAVGPHIGACCYEVDAPVVEPLSARFGAALNAALVPSRPGHHWIDLGRLVVADLHRAGVPAERVGTAAALCTACDPSRFESFRRDGASAGRLVHWVAAGASPP
ncbi:MAG TPA: laccase domain-containing protein [Alphaproteobacteria bacterium]|nr:laccase domain-containing protein [Alphaproteobacteria bacterium]